MRLLLEVLTWLLVGHVVSLLEDDQTLDALVE